MRYITYILLILICFILQTTLVSYIELTGIKPNLILILIISFGFLRGEIEGALIGFASGILIDIFFGSFLGLNAFIFFIIGFLSGKILQNFYKENLALPFLLTLILSSLYNLINFFFNSVLKGNPNILPVLKSTIIPEVLYTSLISFFIYKIFYLIDIKIERFDKPKRKFF